MDMLSYSPPSPVFQHRVVAAPIIPTAYQQATLTELLTKKERIYSARPVGGHPTAQPIKRIPLAKRYSSRPSI